MTSTSTNNQEEEKASALFIGDAYSFLALSMRYPEEKTHNQDFFEALDTLLAALHWDEQRRTLSSWYLSCETPTALQDALQVEYTRLFINSVPNTTVPPFASVFLDGDGTMQGKSTEKIRQFYRQYGYEVENQDVPSDHITYQLEFLAAITKDAMFQEEEQFLALFFRPWFGQFYSQCLQKTRHPFYTVSLQLIDFFTKEEQ